MIPDSAVAILAFLVLLSPGLVFEWLRRLHRPSLGRSAFEEVSTVVLASLFFSLVAVVVLLIAAWFLPDLFVDGDAWASDGSTYAREQPTKVATTVGAAVAVAWVAAIVANRFLETKFYKVRIASTLRTLAGGTQDRNIVDHNMWWHLISGRHRPADTLAVWLEINTVDGQRYWGVVSAVDLEGDDASRAIVLRRPFYGDPPLSTNPSVTWRRLLIPLSQVRSARVYHSKTDAPEPTN